MLRAALQLERQLRLAVARYKELQLELGRLQAEAEQLRRESGRREQPAMDQGQVRMPANEAQPQGSPIAVPQPADDRCGHFSYQGSLLLDAVLCVCVAVRSDFPIAQVAKAACDRQVEAEQCMRGSWAATEDNMC